MYKAFDSFEEAQVAARHLAKKLRSTVSLAHINGIGWQVHLASGEEIVELRKPFNLLSSEPGDTLDDDEYYSEIAEHDCINEDYYREQRIINEGTHEEYIRYLYNP